MDASELDRALDVAREAADGAAQVLRHYYRRELHVQIKADATPVTEADREAERTIREILRASYPEHAILGEEQGRDGEHECLWLVDPLDGTKSFLRGTPFFSTQIGLMVGGSLVLGVSSAPVYGEVMWARDGGGAWLDGERVQVAATGRLDQATVSTGNIGSLAASDRWPALGQLLAGANRTRGYGDFCHYHLLARGALDLVIESDVNILDIAALTVIVREAGGVVTDLQGHGPGLDTRSTLCGVGALHAEALRMLCA